MTLLSIVELNHLLDNLYVEQLVGDVFV